MMPLSIELRMGAITLLETLRHALTLVGVAVLVLAGASLLPFFGVQVAVGVAVLLLTPFFVVGVVGMRPTIDRATASALLRESLPLAAALAMNVIYLRLLVILVSVQTDEFETGLFATSFRIFEILLGIPTLVLAVALPAARRRRRRGPAASPLRPAADDRGGRRRSRSCSCSSPSCLPSRRSCCSATSSIGTQLRSSRCRPSRCSGSSSARSGRSG